MLGATSRSETYFEFVVPPLGGFDTPALPPKGGTTNDRRLSARDAALYWPEEFVLLLCFRLFFLSGKRQRG